MVHSPARPDTPVVGNEARRPPSPLARLSLVALGLIVPLLLLELALRALGPLLPGDYQTASFVETHPAFGRRNRPGEGWKRTSEYTSWVAINSKGLRGPEIEFAKPPGETRVLVLGDSFTFAEQVNQHETFVSRLEQRLNAAGGSRTFRVLNGGSNGWSTANELIYLAKEGVRYEPDVIVVALYVGNDITDNFRRVAAARDAERADLALRGTDPLEAGRKVLRLSTAYTLLESGVLAKLPQPAAAEDDSEAAIRPPPKTNADASEAWAITESLLDRVNQVARSQGASLVTMVIPSLDQVVADPAGADPDDEDAKDELPGFEDPQATLAAIADRLGVPLLDLLPPLRQQTARSRERLYYRINSHFTAAGHALTAEELYGFLVAIGMVG